MRTAHKLKMTEVRNIQKNVKEKLEKETDALIQLMDLPDFDTSEFLQTLLKSQRYMEVLERIPTDKKIYFFAKNYQAFLQTQDELLKLQLPKLQEIPRAKNFTFQQEKEEEVQDNFEETSVLEIIDSFSSFVLEKNLEETLRVFQIIQEMKKHSKYKPYFDNYSTNKIFLETYNSFVESCTSYEILLKINEQDLAIKVYLQEKEQGILNEIKVNLNLNDSAGSMAKEMLRLVQFVEKEVKLFKIAFRKELQKNQYMNTYISEWIKKLTKKYYSLIESYIYEKEELSDILAALNANLEKSTELEDKGISLQRELKEMIAFDLPLHISKVIEIIIDSVNEILKEKNELYEFTYFASIKKFSTELGNLKQITKEDFGIKCATCKGIILVNSFVLILSTLCDEKWSFIHEGVLDILINKIALNILNCTLHYWDYYFIFKFFQRLAAGKVRHKQLISGEVSSGLNQKLLKIKNLSQSSWELFESKLANQFFKETLSMIPDQLYTFKKYGYSLEKPDYRPSTFSISVIFKVEDFFKQIQYRISEHQTEYLATTFFEYVLFTIEYVLFWSYHNKGSNDKVFSLSIKQQKLLKKVKEFNYLQIETIKSRNILELSKLSKHGFLKLIFEVYFLADVFKLITKVQKLDCEQFSSRLSKVLAKDQRKEVIDTSRKQFQEDLVKMTRVYIQKPQMMHNYMRDKKKT